MGREVKRVPMDFNWPLKKIWKGYLPEAAKEVECPHCGCTGLIKECADYYNQFYPENGWKMNPYIPNRRYSRYNRWFNFERWEYEFILSNEELRNEVFANDAIPPFEGLADYFLRHENRPAIGWHAEDFLDEFCRRKGLKDREMYCPHCNGSGRLYYDSDGKQITEDEAEKLNESATYDPPTGDGYQLWENTSEGSPVSPVFASLEELAAWCEPNAYTFADYQATKEEWLDMFKKQFIHTDVKFSDGVTATFI